MGQAKRLETIAVIGTGDMGAAVGGALRRAGLRVVTDLTRRSAHSRALAAAAGVEDLRSLERLVREAQLVLSIVPPAAAGDFAADVAAAMTATGARPAFADCNAVSPATVRGIAALFEPLGADFIDVGIVGRGPPAKLATRFYFSGPRRACLAALPARELKLIDMGPQIGTASALKMSYAVLNKGTDALFATVLLLAEQLGVRDTLMRELASSQAPALARMTERVPFLAATAERYIGEMREIGATFDAAAVTPAFAHGAEWLYALLATTPLAAETRATLARERSLDEAIAVFAAALERQDQKR